MIRVTELLHQINDQRRHKTQNNVIFQVKNELFLFLLGSLIRVDLPLSHHEYFFVMNTTLKCHLIIIWEDLIYIILDF